MYNEQNKVSEVNEQNKVSEVNEQTQQQQEVSEVDEQIENAEQELEEDDGSFEMVDSSEDIEKLLKLPIKGSRDIFIESTLVEEILKGDKKANNSLQKLYEKCKIKNSVELPIFTFCIFLYKIKFEKSVPLYKLVPETHLNINLKSLTIDYCNIDSYECLCLFEFEKLKRLQLHRNNAGSLRFLAKSNLKKLETFAITSCLISSTERMFRARLGKLKCVDIDTDSYSDMKIHLSVNPVDLIKLDGDTIELIDFRTSHFRKDIGILGYRDIIEKRFSNARITIDKPR